MTIRLLSTYDSFPPQSIITLAPAIEAALIADGNASATLTGGTVAYRERAPVMIQPAVQKRGTVNLIANRKAAVPLTEGSALTITPTAGTTGTCQRYDASGAAVGALTTIGATALTVGPFEGDQTVEIKCTTGTMAAKVSDAVLGAASPATDASGNIIGVQKTDGTAFLSSGKVQRSNVMGAQVYATVVSQAQTASDFTYHMTIVLPTDCTAFRIALDNASLTLPFRIKSAIIATSDSVGPDPTFGPTTNQVRFTPQNGTAWKALTWDSGVANVEIAVAPAANRKTRKWSDWIDANTVANTDGSGRRVAMVRFKVEGTTSSPGNGYCTGGYPLTWRTLATDAALHGGYLWQCIRYSGDGVTTPANFQPTTDLKATPFLTSLEYVSRKPGITINAFGDSVTAGAVNAGGGNFGNGWLWQLVQLLRAKYPNIPIDMANNGVPSANSGIYSQHALDYIAAGATIGLPIYQAFTQNDGTPSAAFVATQMRRMGAVAAVLQALGKTVVLPTPIPNTSLAWAAGPDAIRLALRDEIFGIRDSGATVALDQEVVSDGAVPARYAAAYTTDGAHPNEAGHAVLAAAALPHISKLIG